MANPHFEHIEDEARTLHDSWLSVARLSAGVGAIAIAVWALVSALKIAVERAIAGLYWLGTGENWWGALGLTLTMATVGVLRGRLLSRPAWRLTSGDGMSLALERYHDDSAEDRWPEQIGLALKKFIATLLTLGGGGSGGLEAPSLLLGQSFSAGLAKAFKLRGLAELRIYQLAGMAAAVSTLLGAPFTAALFVLEISYGERLVYRKLAYALWAGVVAFWLNTMVRGYHPMFLAPHHSPIYSFAEYGASALVAVAVALPVAIGVRSIMRWARQIVHQVRPGWHALASTLLLAVIAITFQRLLRLDPRYILGSGDETLIQLLHNESGLQTWWMLLVLLLAKITTTGLTIGGGGSVGLLFPSMYFGGVAGALVAALMRLTGLAQLDPALFAVVGIASSLSAVVGVPLAAMALVFEVFGKAYGPPTILACGLTYILSLRFNIIREQGGLFVLNPLRIIGWRPKDP